MYVQCELMGLLLVMYVSCKLMGLLGNCRWAVRLEMKTKISFLFCMTIYKLAECPQSSCDETQKMRRFHTNLHHPRRSRRPYHSTSIQQAPRGFLFLMWKRRKREAVQLNTPCFVDRYKHVDGQPAKLQEGMGNDSGIWRLSPPLQSPASLPLLLWRSWDSQTFCAQYNLSIWHFFNTRYILGKSHSLSNSGFL